MSAARARSGRAPDLPARVLIVSGDQWPRALVRAELEAAGWDAVGAPDLRWAARTLPEEPGRGPVRLVILDQDVAGDAAALDALRALHPAAPILLLGHRLRGPPPGPWAEVLLRPLSVADVVAASARLAGAWMGPSLPPRSRTRPARLRGDSNRRSRGRRGAGGRPADAEIPRRRRP